MKHSNAVMFVCGIAFTETEHFPVHKNGIVQLQPASPLFDMLPHLTPRIYRDDTGLKASEGRQYLAASLSEGTITDSTPSSAINHQTPSMEEGTILSSISSYRSIAERPPGVYVT